MTPAPVYVHLLPSLVQPASLAGGTAVIIDVLRASTTICAALQAGAAGVRITGEVEEARRLAAAAGERNRVVLGGERGGARIDGFDLGNSPDEYTPASIGDRTVIFTTTNGTRAAIHALRAERVVVGCFANVGAVARALAADGRPVHLLCAGTEGEISIEDSLGAGAIADALAAAGTHTLLGDQALLAREAWRSVAAAGSLVETMRAGRGGGNIRRLGLDSDLRRCAELDWCRIVPVLDVEAMTFRALG